MVEPAKVSELRREDWRSIPTSPGVYWWYFPVECLEQFKIAEFCPLNRLNLRVAPDGKVCLYHGLANSLSDRIKWHAAQKLSFNNLRSGFLSTCRLTLLALNGFNYSPGSEAINTFFDTLHLDWQSTQSRQSAEKLEKAELSGAYHYPLNIAGNRCADLRNYIGHLKSERSAYKRLSLSRGSQDDN